MASLVFLEVATVYRAGVNEFEYAIAKLPGYRDCVIRPVASRDMKKIKKSPSSVTGFE
jgi:hypothetical protein